MKTNEILMKTEKWSSMKTHGNSNDNETLMKTHWYSVPIPLMKNFNETFVFHRFFIEILLTGKEIVTTEKLHLKSKFIALDGEDLCSWHKNEYHSWYTDLKAILFILF